jgi:hypothetical protein
MRKRIIDQLRKAFPGTWSWDPNLREWVSGTGLRVYCCAVLAPRYDGDDSSFELQYRERTSGAVLGVGHHIFALTGLMERR